MTNWFYISDETKNFCARIIVFLWIFALAASAAWVAHFALIVDVNGFLGLSGDNLLGKEAVNEIKLILVMLSIATF